MYLDQGRIAIKLPGFLMGVSVLSGLRFAMITPARGTTFDFVGRIKAAVEPARRTCLICARMAANARERAA